MTKFTDHLWSDLVREHGATLAHATSSAPGRAGVLRRPRILAGSTLGLAGVGAALVLALGGSSAPPAYAITQNGDGSVTVQINEASSMVTANHQLSRMGIDEQIGIAMARGPASVSGPVTCAPQRGDSGPTVKVLLGSDGTEVINAGHSGAGTWHLSACGAFPGNTSLSTLRQYSGNSGA